MLIFLFSLAKSLPQSGIYHLCKLVSWGDPCVTINSNNLKGQTFSIKMAPRDSSSQWKFDLNDGLYSISRYLGNTQYCLGIKQPLKQLTEVNVQVCGTQPQYQKWNLVKDPQSPLYNIRPASNSNLTVYMNNQAILTTSEFKFDLLWSIKKPRL